MWGVIEIDENPELDLPASRHVVPMVSIDGELVPSAAHTLNPNCPCHPRDIGDHDFTSDNWTGQIWNHNDEEAPGSMERVAMGIDKSGPAQ